MFGDYGNGFNQYPPMQQQSQYPFIQQKPAQFTPQPQQPVVKPPAMLYTVSNRTEVEAYMVACDGSTTYFLCPAENCIYSKSVDMMGRPVINTFALQNSNPVQTKLYSRCSEIDRTMLAYSKWCRERHLNNSLRLYLTWLILIRYPVSK